MKRTFLLVAVNFAVLMTLSVAASVLFAVFGVPLE